MRPGCEAGATVGRDETVELLSSRRLVPLWAEAGAHVRDLDASDPRWWRWRQALTALAAAMDETERIAARERPGLGRRHWAARQP